MSASDEQSIRAMFDHHTKAFLAGDVDALLEDYSEEIVMRANIEPSETRGSTALRAMWAGMFQQLLTPEALKAFKIHSQIFEGDVIFETWSMEPLVTFGVDTFVVRDGKIVKQFAGVQMAQP